MTSKGERRTCILSKSEIFFASILESLRKIDDKAYSVFTSRLEMTRNSIRSLHEIHLALLQGEYRSNYWDFICDYTKSLKYIVDNYYSGSKQVRNAKRFYNILNQKVESHMIQLGFCCGTCFIHETIDIYCCEKNCLVEENAIFYRYKDWLYCEKCFDKKGEDVEMESDLIVNKRDFKLCRYVSEAFEDFVFCIACGRKFHEHCVLHIKSSEVPFCCKNCRATATNTIAEMKLSAENLPTTECDEFIMRHLEKCELPMQKKLIIRLVSSIEKTLHVKKTIANYRTHSQITYRNNSLFAFFKTPEGNDVCFFGCYFQLYDSKCESPSNKGCVYLSYIDSVNLLDVPDRSQTYQQLIIGLFDFFKSKNFSKIFIWSCPPKRHVDYIFLDKPPGMKIPTPARLVEWYNKLFALTKQLQVIESFEGVDKYAKDRDWRDLDKVPYFDGDLWPTRIQEAIVQAEKQAKKRNLTDRDIIDRVWEILQVQLEFFDRSYYVLFLKYDECGDTLPMAAINCQFSNERTDLVNFFWDRKLEFADMRLAKFSSFFLIYMLLRANSICQNCRKLMDLDIWLQCNECSADNQIFHPQPKRVRLEEEKMEHVTVDPITLQMLKQSLQNERKVERPIKMGNLVVEIKHFPLRYPIRLKRLKSIQSPLLGFSRSQIFDEDAHSVMQLSLNYGFSFNEAF